MSANSRQYTRALYLLDAVARRVPADAWDNPSCCEGWTAREVAGHASWVIRNVGAATGNMAAPEPQAAPFRLHVVEAGSLEVRSHRVLPDPECPSCAD